MENSQALVPQAVKEIEFYGDAIQIAIVNGAAYIALRPLTEHLGMEWGSQRLRTQRDEVLVAEVRQVLMTGADGKQRQMFAIPLEFLPGWLFGITPSRARPELTAKLTRYRRECFSVLWRAFQSEINIASPQTSSSGGTLIQVRNLGLAVAQLAEQQMELQERVTTVDVKINQAEIAVQDLQQRLNTVEEWIEPKGTISNKQATEISNTVKALAEALTKKDPSKNHYQSIFAELYRRFQVSSYKLIKQGQYKAVVKFLDDWQESAGIPKRPMQDELF
jgi:hypothetical protein